MTGFLTIFHDTAEPDSPWSWKRVACTILLLLILPVIIVGLVLMVRADSPETAKWIGLASAAFVALFIVAILWLMGYAASIEKAISAARGGDIQPPPRPEA